MPSSGHCKRNDRLARPGVFEYHAARPGIMNLAIIRTWLPAGWLNRFTLAPTDLLRDATYRRLWTSILISSFGGQVTLLAIPLTAAVLMHAAPTQMGLLTAMEIVPFVLFSLADRRVARPGAEITGVRGRRIVDRVRRGDGAGGVVVRLAVDALAVLRRLLDRRRQYDRRQRGTNRADADRAARPPGRSACQERARELRGGGDRSRCRGRADQTDRRARRAAGGRVSAAVIRVDPARRSRERESGGQASELLGCDARGNRLRARPSIVGHHGDLRRRMANVQSGGDGGADPVCHASAGTVGARRGIELRGARRGHGPRQRDRASRRAPLRSRTHAGARLCRLRQRLAAAEHCAPECRWVWLRTRSCC